MSIDSTICLIFILPTPAAWNFVEEHKAEIGWDISVINPPFVSSFSTAIRKSLMIILTISGLRCKSISEHLNESCLADLCASTARHPRFHDYSVLKHFPPDLD